MNSVERLQLPNKLTFDTLDLPPPNLQNSPLKSLKNIQERLNQSMKFLGIDPEQKLPNRKDIIKIVQTMGYKISYFQAAEALGQCRGDKLEMSDYFSLNELAKWFSEHYGILR